MGLATGNSEPAPSTVEAAATDKEQDNYYDEKCGGIHDSLQAKPTGRFARLKLLRRKRNLDGQEWFLRCS